MTERQREICIPDGLCPKKKVRSTTLKLYFETLTPSTPMGPSFFVSANLKAVRVPVRGEQRHKFWSQLWGIWEGYLKGKNVNRT